MSKPRNLNHVARDKGYRWTDTDPELEEARRHVTDSGLSLKEISDRTAKATSGLHRIAVATLRNIMNGTTRRPQNVTLEWTAFALGYRRVKWVKIR